MCVKALIYIPPNRLNGTMRKDVVIHNHSICLKIDPLSIVCGLSPRFPMSFHVSAVEIPEEFRQRSSSVERPVRQVCCSTSR